MQTESTAPATNHTRRLLLIVLLVCVLLGAALFAISLSNRAQLRRQLREIGERGELVVLPQASETEAGRATRELLRQFDNAKGDDHEWSLDQEEGVARFLGLPEGLRLDEEARAQLEQLKLCLGRDPLRRPGWHLHALMQDGVSLEHMEECDRAFLVA